MALKIALSILGFWYAFQMIDVDLFKSTIQDANYIYVTLAVVFYLISQWLSSYRLRYVLTAINDDVPTRWNIKLYWQGMAYNLFLPGGIGGDAYKMIAYSKRSGIPSKQYILPLLVDRLLGLCAIIPILIPFVPFINPYDWIDKLAILTPFLVLIVGYFVVKKWFSSYLPKIWKGLTFSVGIQGLQVISVLCILFSIQGEFSVTSIIPLTIFVFLLSSIATAIPVFMGGLGAREVVFAYVFTAVDQSSDTGVWIALFFSTILVISSLPGLLLGFSKD